MMTPAERCALEPAGVRNREESQVVDGVEYRGPWGRFQVEQHSLDSRIPIRLGVQLSSGFPSVVSLWFWPEQGCYWCAVHESANVLRWLRRNNKVAFEISSDQPPYRGIRGQAIASLEKGEGERILRSVIQRYLGNESSSLATWLLSRVDEEWAICLKPVRVFSWDYSERMEGLHLNQP